MTRLLEAVRSSVDERVDGTDGEDPRMRKRRSDVAQQHGRRRARRLTGLATVVTIGIGLWVAHNSSLLDIERIEVSGVSQVSADDVAAAAGLRVGDPVLALRGGAADDGAESLSWVHSAEVSRAVMSGTVRIAVTERVPVAVVDLGDGTWMLVDADTVALAVVDEVPVVGRVGSGTSETDVAMVSVRGLEAVRPGESLGPAARGALDVIAALPQRGVGTRVESVVVDDDQLELVLRPFGRVRFGRATQIDAKIRSLQAVVAQVDLIDLCQIDLRVPSSPVVDRSPQCA